MDFEFFITYFLFLYEFSISAGEIEKRRNKQYRKEKNTLKHVI